jgi:hypothetical protein
MVENKNKVMGAFPGLGQERLENIGPEGIPSPYFLRNIREIYANIHLE